MRVLFCPCDTRRAGLGALGVNRTMQEVPFERMMMKLKPVTCCAAALHCASPRLPWLTLAQGSTFKQRENLINR